MGSQYSSSGGSQTLEELMGSQFSSRGGSQPFGEVIINNIYIYIILIVASLLLYG
jgi:hypothetical protein